MVAHLLAVLFECWHDWISPLLPKACRFEPTCSIYGAQALRKFGLRRGLFLTVKRLATCHPWHQGGFDPVP